MSRALHHLAPGQEARIVALHAGEALQHRLAALGFRIGKQVRMVRRAAFNGPLHVRIDHTDVIIRRSDACCVELCTEAVATTAELHAVHAAS